MPSSPEPRPLELEADLPTSAEDVAVLRALRQARGHGLTRRLRLLRVPTWLAGDCLRRRRTFSGCEPFEL